MGNFNRFRTVDRVYKNILSKKRVDRSTLFLSDSIICGATNQIEVVFGGITVSFIIAGMITLLKIK